VTSVRSDSAIVPFVLMPFGDALIAAHLAGRMDANLASPSIQSMCDRRRGDGTTSHRKTNKIAAAIKMEPTRIVIGTVILPEAERGGDHRK
jgi:hypothetical protein